LETELFLANGQKGGQKDTMRLTVAFRSGKNAPIIPQNTELLFS